jgi:hypothetical protein
VWPLFGGYHGYMRAPAFLVLRQKLRIVAKWQAQKEENDKVEDDARFERENR